MAVVDSFYLLQKGISRSYLTHTEPLLLLGTFYAAKQALWFLRCAFGLARNVVRLLKPHHLPSQCGEWAVVCGIHDGGLGQAYARELALRGFSVALIGKDQHNLELVADMIEQSSKVKTLVVVTTGGPGCVDRCAIAHNFDEMDIGVFVWLLPPHKPMQPLTSRVQEMTASVWRDTWWLLGSEPLIELVLPAMIERGRGGIVLVIPPNYLLSDDPRLSADTAFLECYSRGLRLGLAPLGLFVQLLTPLRLASPITTLVGFRYAIDQPSLFTPTPETYAKYAVWTLGVLPCTAGYWPHSLQLMLSRWLPKCFRSIF
uniref:inactive hydroxysteroid dehydrogenase-like protein 1 n=1 Tax=Myxine glutinosa TaxID=7769 RepID=UPI00358F9C3C